MIQLQHGIDSAKTGKLTVFRNMLLKNFRTAAKGQGEYCPVKNELRIRRGRKVYRFTCRGDGELRFTAPNEPEVVINISADATVRELKRGIPLIIDSHVTQRQ